MKNSAVVQMLADFASKGVYSMTPPQARQINALYTEVARVINELEAEEKASE